MEMQKVVLVITDLWSNLMILYASLTCTDGDDFVGVSPTNIELTPSNINMLICVNITIIDDDIVEDEETFSCVLSSNDSAVVFSPNTSVVTIIDDDSK